MTGTLREMDVEVPYSLSLSQRVGYVVLRLKGLISQKTCFSFGFWNEGGREVR